MKALTPCCSASQRIRLVFWIWYVIDCVRSIMMNISRGEGSIPTPTPAHWAPASASTVPASTATVPIGKPGQAGGRPWLVVVPPVVDVEDEVEVLPPVVPVAPPPAALPPEASSCAISARGAQPKEASVGTKRASQGLSTARCKFGIYDNECELPAIPSRNFGTRGDVA